MILGEDESCHIIRVQMLFVRHGGLSRSCLCTFMRGILYKYKMKSHVYYAPCLDSIPIQGGARRDWTSHVDI